MKGPWLVFLPYVPYPITRGTYQRVYHLTQALGQSVEIDLFCLAENGEGHDQETAFSGFTRRFQSVTFHHPPWKGVFSGRLFQPLPSTVMHWQSKEVEDALAAFCEGQEYTGIVFCDLVLWPYIRKLFPHQRLRVMDRSRVDWLFQTEELNTLKLSFKDRLLRRENLSKIARLEKAAYSDLTAEVVCGPDDKTFLREKLGQDSKIHVLANGYNTTYFDVEKHPRDLSAHPSVLFCGALDYTPNRDGLDWFLEEIHPLILKEIPDYVFTIVGRNPPDDLADKADRPGVKLIGEVPDVRPWYQSCWIQAVPLRIGGGTRLKIVESLAMKTSVVSTHLGAQGLHLVHGKDILLADKPADFAHQVSHVLKTENLRKYLEDEGLKTTRENYTWTALGKQYVEIMEGLQDELI
jgi:glycosyltransferase involved in cell wall biosynthesis